MAFIFDANPGCLAAALRTITPDHRCFQKISFDMTGPYNYWKMELIDSINRAEWLEFDSLLAQLWESHGSRVDAQCHSIPPYHWIPMEKVRECADGLLPKATERGIVDITESAGEPFLTPPWDLTRI